MSKTDSDSNQFAISFGKEMPQNESFIDNLDDFEDNFDAFNDETFGEIDSSNWEVEHEKLTAFVDHTRDQPIISPINENKFNSNNKNSFLKSNTKLNSFNDNLNENNRSEDSAYDDIVVKSISTLGLEDDEFEDPAIMTFARSHKSQSSGLLLGSSSPPPAILSYEEYSASPKTQTIWSTTKLDTTLTPTISSANMRTLEDIEQDLLNKNNDKLFELSTIKRPIRVEELEANLLNQSSNKQFSDNPFVNNCIQIQNAETGWTPFESKAMHHMIPNGRPNQELIETFKNNCRSDITSKISSVEPEESSCFQMEAKVPNVSTEPLNIKKDSLEPLIKAQTLSEIERQLISRQSPPQAKPPQNITNSPSPHSKANATPVVHNSPPKPFGHQFSQFRPQMMPQNRVNNLFNRPPVMHYMPGMHPAMGRAMFSPALIPNSQRIFPFPLHSRPILHPLLQHSLHLQQQQQQHLHQQQHNMHFFNRNQYPRFGHQKYHENYENEDEYAGLMTQRDKEWLIRIQQMQTELKDPYVDDYYNVTYMSRKIAAAAANDKDNKTTPSLLLPERPKPVVEPQTNKYIPVQFEGSLGKIQVSNVNCPRKLLDCSVNKTSNDSNNESLSDVKVANKSEVSKFRKLLLEIEKLYVVLLNIDDEDKRIGALPEEARKSHFETRKQLCDKLFKGLTNETKDKINLEVVQIKKGLALLFRSLSYLSDESQRAVIISDLLNATNYRQYVIKPKDRLDYGQMLINAIYNITNHEVLLKIVSGINNIALIIKSEYGHRIIESLINQFDKMEASPQINSKWSIFVNYVLDEVDDIQHLRILCRNHLMKLGF